MKKILLIGLLFLIMIVGVSATSYTPEQLSNVNIRCNDWNWVKTQSDVVAQTTSMGLKPTIFNNQVLFKVYYNDIKLNETTGNYDVYRDMYIIHLGNLDFFNRLKRNYGMPYVNNAINEMVKESAKEHLSNYWCGELKKLQNDINQAIISEDDFNIIDMSN